MPPAPAVVSFDPPLPVADEVPLVVPLAPVLGWPASLPAVSSEGVPPESLHPAAHATHSTARPTDPKIWFLTRLLLVK
jgi:hypothetical protein